MVGGFKTWTSNARQEAQAHEKIRKDAATPKVQRERMTVPQMKTSPAPRDLKPHGNKGR